VPFPDRRPSPVRCNLRVHGTSNASPEVCLVREIKGSVVHRSDPFLGPARAADTLANVAFAETFIVGNKPARATRIAARQREIALRRSNGLVGNVDLIHQRAQLRIAEHLPPSATGISSCGSPGFQPSASRKVGGCCSLYAVVQGGWHVYLGPTVHAASEIAKKKRAAGQPPWEPDASDDELEGQCDSR
jgi:hypothetical protein